MSVVVVFENECIVDNKCFLLVKPSHQNETIADVSIKIGEEHPQNLFPITTEPQRDSARRYYFTPTHSGSAELTISYGQRDELQSTTIPFEVAADDQGQNEAPLDPGDAPPPPKEVQKVALQSSSTEPDPGDTDLIALRKISDSLSFEAYEKHIALLCTEQSQPSDSHLSYQKLKEATEKFLLDRGHSIEPDIRAQLAGRPQSFLGTTIQGSEAPQEGFMRTAANRLIAGGPEARPFCEPQGAKSGPKDDLFLEYIWTFYHEIGMLDQSIKALALRFQNKQSGRLKNQLVDLEISYLRPITDFLWDYINDEPHRLSVPRRTLEYQNQYGLAVTGKATQGIRSVGERSSFLSAFHTVLANCHEVYRQEADLTVDSAAAVFALQTTLRTLSTVLLDGAYNQFSRATFQSRAEFMIAQWLLSRNATRIFLRGKEGSPYTESWMAPVETMRRLQGWGTESIGPYRDLAVLGERLLLSVRFGKWNGSNVNRAKVRNWALFFREDVQLYCHSYKQLTGVDLTDPKKIDTTQPVVLIERFQKQLKKAS